MAHKTYIKDNIVTSNAVVVFIHGFLGSTEHFERFIAKLPDNISIYNILLDGHGGSVLDFAHASMEKWKKQIKDIVDMLAKQERDIYIVGHSMGTFLAIESAIVHPENVKVLFLLQVPLKIWVRPAAVINTVKSFSPGFFHDKSDEFYKKAHSVKLNFRLWEYIGWIPRYMELFRESKKIRTIILNLETPCWIFQSAKDELVSMKSVNFIPNKEGMKLAVLKNSAHFIYDEDEFTYMEEIFCKIIECI